MSSTQLRHPGLITAYDRLRITREKGNRDGVRFRSMVTRMGGVDTAKRLLTDYSNKYRWWKIASHPDASFGMVDNSIEFQVLRPKFRTLFTDEEIAEAKSRLKRMREIETG